MKLCEEMDVPSSVIINVENRLLKWYGHTELSEEER
jgi:hypothetical protein